MPYCLTSRSGYRTLHSLSRSARLLFESRNVVQPLTRYRDLSDCGRVSSHLQGRGVYYGHSQMYSRADISESLTLSSLDDQLDQAQELRCLTREAQGHGSGAVQRPLDGGPARGSSKLGVLR